MLTNLKKMKSKVAAKCYLAIGSALLFAPSAFACTTKNKDGLSGFVCRINEELNSVGDLAINFFYLVGLILFGGGIWLLNKDQKQPGQDHAKKGAWAMGVGVGMIVITTLINMFASTATGTNVKENEYKVGSKDI